MKNTLMDMEVNRRGGRAREMVKKIQLISRTNFLSCNIPHNVVRLHDDVKATAN